MKAIILAAGYGKRLYNTALEKGIEQAEYAKKTPKALLKIGYKPLINFLLNRLQELDVKEVRIISNEFFKNAFEEWEKEYSKTFPFKIELCYNNSRIWGDNRGAVVDLSIASGFLPSKKTQEDLNMNATCKNKPLDEDCIVLLGDRWLSEKVGLKEFSEKMKKENSNVLGLFNTKDIGKMLKKSQVKINIKGEITHFEEKSPNPQSTITCPGPYFLKNKDFKTISDFLEEQTKNKKRIDAPGNFIQYLFETKKPLKGILLEEEPYDFGQWNNYKQAEKEILENQI